MYNSTLGTAGAVIIVLLSVVTLVWARRESNRTHKKLELELEIKAKALVLRRALVGSYYDDAENFEGLRDRVTNFLDDIEEDLEDI